MSKLLKSLVVVGLMFVGGQVFAAHGSDGGGDGPVTRNLQLPHVPHSGK